MGPGPEPLPASCLCLMCDRGRVVFVGAPLHVGRSAAAAPRPGGVGAEAVQLAPLPAPSVACASRRKHGVNSPGAVQFALIPAPSVTCASRRKYGVTSPRRQLPTPARGTGARSPPGRHSDAIPPPPPPLPPTSGRGVTAAMAPLAAAHPGGPACGRTGDLGTSGARCLAPISTNACRRMDAVRQQWRRRSGRRVATACSQGSPPPGFPENVINFVSVAVRQSPVNGVKQAIARAQAGNFDEAAVRGTVDGYIRDNKVRCTCVLDTFRKEVGQKVRVERWGTSQRI